MDALSVLIIVGLFVVLVVLPIRRGIRMRAMGRALDHLAAKTDRLERDAQQRAEALEARVDQALGHLRELGRRLEAIEAGRTPAPPGAPADVLPAAMEGAPGPLAQPQAPPTPAEIVHATPELAAPPESPHVGPELAAAAAPSEAPSDRRAALAAAEAAGVAAVPAPPPQRRPSRESGKSPASVLAERFLENWTGILGAFVLVAGTTFLGIYTALKLAHFYRFLLTTCAACALIGASVVLGRLMRWRAFAAWVRAAGAAILLFACAASGYLPGLGLEWITDRNAALALLAFGIAVNLLLAHAGAAQTLATVYVLVSMTPMAIVAPSATSLAVASVVAAFGVGPLMRRGWDRHLAIVVGAYALLQVRWLAGMGVSLPSEALRLVGVACSVAVFGTATLAHHRQGFAAAQASPEQLAIRVLAWALLAFALHVYLPDAGERCWALVGVAAVAYALGLHGRRLGVPWLRRTDMLTAEAFVLLAIANAYALVASAALLALAALIESIVFRWLVGRERDPVLDGVANVLPAIAAALLLLIGCNDIAARTDKPLETAAALFCGAAVATLGQWLLRPPLHDADGTPAGGAGDRLLPAQAYALQAGSVAREILGGLAGALVLAALVASQGPRWREASALVAGAALLVAWRSLRTAGIWVGATVALLGAHLLAWASLAAPSTPGAYEVSLGLLPMGALAAVAIAVGEGGALRTAGIALLGADIGLAALLYFDPVSSLIPGVLWLMLSVLALELADRLAGASARTVLAVGVAYLVAFAAAYARVVIQSPAYLGPIRARLLIELFALAVIGYWWLFRPRPALAEQRLWTAVHPWFVDVLMIGLAATIVVELPARWWAISWAATALALLGPISARLLGERAFFYAMVFYWVSVADMAASLSVMQVPSPLWYERPQFTALVAIALQVLFVAWARRRIVAGRFASLAAGSLAARLAGALTARLHLYVFYPLFAGIAVFLFWRFDRSVLTLLWALEAFVVFVLGAWLRENQFRYVALAGLSACLVRLVLVDMAQANLAVRGLVFIGVGLLMLGMNAIYNRYRGRFGA